jgi:hypothetical protein
VGFCTDSGVRWRAGDVKNSRDYPQITQITQIKRGVGKEGRSGDLKCQISDHKAGSQNGGSQITVDGDLRWRSRSQISDL